jgi:hypothetical protein
MKKKSVTAPLCGDCVHCVPIEGTNEGSCRRHPPIPMMKVDGHVVSAFPQVRLADIWCGDFVQQKAREAK